MIDLIVFSVGNSRYALSIENIKRILQAKQLTTVPNSSTLIDGMMSHENSVIQVLNFRKLIGLVPYDAELQKSFSRFKALYEEWMDALKDALQKGTVFSKTTNPHTCELGMWLASFNSYDANVTTLLKELIFSHKNLYTLGNDALELSKTDKAQAQKMLENEVYEGFKKTIHNLDLFVGELESVANSLQKLILYEKSGTTFAIKVDTIEDIAHIEDSKIMSNNEDRAGEYLELSGILDLDGVLVNVIKNIDLPK